MSDETALPYDSLRAVLDTTADGIVVVDEYGIVCYANRAAERLFDRRRDDLVGHFFDSPLQRVGPTEIGLFSGERPLTVEMRTAEITWDGRDARLATLHDVTERKAAEESLRRAVAVRDEVLDLIGHDLRAPLATILSAGRLLADGADEDGAGDAPTEEELVATILDQAGHLRRLVENLLTLARLEAGQLQLAPADLDIARVARQAAGDLGDEVEVDLTDVPDGLVVAADESCLRSILANLLSNAVKYGAPPFGLRARALEQQVEIVVTDEGDGVPEAFVPQLFERFRRADVAEGAPGGSGLGLALVAQLARACGGEVWYEHHRPRGAAFGVRLPRS